MQDYGVAAESVSTLPPRSTRALLALALTAVALLVGVPAYAGIDSRQLAILYRFGLPVLWAVLAVAAGRSTRLKTAVPVLWSLFGVSLGFALNYLVADKPLEWLGLPTSTPKGAAFSKLSEVVPMCAAIWLSAVLARRSLASFGLRNARVLLSLGLGLLASVPLLVMMVADPAGDMPALLALPAATVLSWTPWILLFSAANGFMEELWFRGSWFGAFRPLVGSPAAMHVTSISFALMHIVVYWGDSATVAILAPVWLYLGYVCALIVRKTGSLWGAVLTHAVADAIFLAVAFGSRGGL
jgi:membrane protease YdiL (CAAX protease family)